MYDVVVRRLGRPTVWGPEVSVYLMLMLAFFGIGHTWTQQGHFRVTLLLDVLDGKVVRWLDFICAAVALSFTIAFTFGAYKLAAFSFMLKFTTPTVLEMPVWLLQCIILVGGIFLALALIEDLLRIIRGEAREEPALPLTTE